MRTLLCRTTALQHVSVVYMSTDNFELYKILLSAVFSSHKPVCALYWNCILLCFVENGKKFWSVVVVHEDLHDVSLIFIVIL